MSRNFNILMYSHDTYGLGHIRRTLSIAQNLNQPGTRVLILTGSPLIRRFPLPRGVDYIKMPGMIKMDKGVYKPSESHLEPDQVLAVRSRMILSAVMTFKPDLFIVDKEPLGLKKEAVRGLEWIRGHLPLTRTVLGLRDIMDEAEVVREDWRQKEVFPALETLYSEIWIYGRSDLYDPIEEYRIPPKIRPKVFFTGYIPRPPAPPSRILAVRKRFAGKKNALVVVTTGGGMDGYPLLDTFFSWCESPGRPGVSFGCLVVFGPFLPEDKKTLLEKRAGRLNISTCAFYDPMNTLVGACDLLVCMGGYNTLCEALSNRTPALVVPREHPRKEQQIRARAMYGKGLVEFLPWSRLAPETLGKKISEMLCQSNGYQKAMAGFEMTGIKNILARIYEPGEAGA